MPERWWIWFGGGGVDMVNGDRHSSTYFKENKRIFHNTGNRWYIYDTSNNKYIKLSNNRNNFYPKYIVLGENTILTEDFENNYYIGKIERN